ncbi:unnamed protein product [Pieris macdunnoughi]|uniref:Uncharacterized protein n=1 Tax=Pieris macdunnoughi TaxID=345717 RepID=A0A821SQQ3_9NEOP|nr:unnamed protein product [Pieris macdunnoughi]
MYFTNYLFFETVDIRNGWFSTCSCRGGALATPRASISALLRNRAFALVSPRAISAYRARPASDSGRVGAQYERAAARPGTPLRLAGVFADGSKAKAPKYAQLIDPQGNVSKKSVFLRFNTGSTVQGREKRETDELS